MASIPTFKLNTGASIPSIALGTWESPNDVVAEAVYTAIRDGYRHIDTAMIYRNEEDVGTGIKRALDELPIKRSDLFITTKLWLTDFKRVESALNASLERLFPGDKDAYVDLYLMHWPIALDQNGNLDPAVDFLDAWNELEKIPESKSRAIGVSNFTIANMKKLLAHAKRTPAVNQVELHTHLPQPKLVNWLLSGKYGFPQHDGKIIIPEGYSPMGRGNLDDPTVKKIAEKHKCSPANVVLSWNIKRDVVVLPKSVTQSRIRDNLKYIELDEEDVMAIDDIINHTELKRHCDMSRACCNIFNDNEDSK